MIENWARSIAFGTERLLRPTSLDELRSAVAAPGPVHALGSRHSFSPIADTRQDGALVSLEAMPVEIDIDADRRQVRVSGGPTYGDVAPYLHKAGWALHNTASLPHISIAGACATGTHGSGDRNGGLATAVAALDIVRADGELVTVARGDADFEGAVVSLGALGFVVAMTLDIRPTFDVRQNVFEHLALDVMYEHFDALMASAYSVSLFTLTWESWMDLVWVKARVSDEVFPAERFGVTPANGPRIPVPGESPSRCTEQMGVPGPWHERLPHFRPESTPSRGSELQSEYLVPRVHAVDALRAVQSLHAQIAPLLYCCEIRTVAADRLWLSPAYERDLMGIHFTWHQEPAAVTAVLPELEARLEPFEVIPHWGKLFTLGPDVVRSRYPRMSDFADLVRRYDPTGKFRNPFLDRYILG